MVWWVCPAQQSTELKQRQGRLGSDLQILEGSLEDGSHRGHPPCSLQQVQGHPGKLATYCEWELPETAPVRSTVYAEAYFLLSTP
jgi:hypothetical protein